MEHTILSACLGDVCAMSKIFRFFFSPKYFFAQRLTLAGYALWWSIAIALPAHAESLEKAIEAYDFEEYQDAAQWLRPWAEKGEIEAQYRLGTLYENGQGIAKNLDAAKKWYRNAAAQGHARARRRLEALEGKSSHSGKETVAIKWYLDLAEQGDADAQYNLAFMYETGFSVPKDNEKAARWYEAAAEKKHVLAEMRLGLMYLAGSGVKQSEIQAAKLLEAAGKGNNKLAAGVNELLLGTGPELPLNKIEIAEKLLGISTKDEKKALALLNATVQEARAVLQRDLANRDAQLAKGKGIKSALEQDANVEFGLDEQGRRTIKWYQRNAEHGSATAQFQLAKYYELGIETQVDIKEAVHWYASAAELGYPEAQFYFAMLNYYGIGVERNEVLAQSLIKAAAQQGHSAAKRLLEETGSALQKQSMALWWLTRFGQEQNGLALRQAGNLYELGRGVRADINNARKYYQASSNTGFKATALQSPIPSTWRASAAGGTVSVLAEGKDGSTTPVQSNVQSLLKAQATPGDKRQGPPLYAQPWIKYPVLALVALLPISAFFWVAMKEKQRMLESRKKARRPAPAKKTA